jgi:hypothetical protein
MSVTALQTKSVSLLRYDAMCRAIEAAYKVDEVKDIRDQAIALETYARQAHNVEAERQACEIRLRAERKVTKPARSARRIPPDRSQQLPRSASRFRRLRCPKVAPRRCGRLSRSTRTPARR